MKNYCSAGTQLTAHTPPPPCHALLIEANSELRQQIADHLINICGYQVDSFAEFSDARDRIAQNAFGAILLGQANASAIKQIRVSGSMSPIIVLAGPNNPDLRISFLDKGADDVVNQPFPLDFLAARIRAFTRRQEWNLAARPSPLAITDRLMLDYFQRGFFLDGKRLPLSRLEYEIFKFLAENRGTLVTPKEIAEATESRNNRNSTAVLIKRIRDAVAAAYGSHTWRMRIIESRKGSKSEGYKLPSYDELMFIRNQGPTLPQSIHAHIAQPS